MHSFLPLIDKAERRQALTSVEAESLMEELLAGRIETPDIARLLLALNQRPISAAELGAFARVMRRHAEPVFATEEDRPAQMLDTCGTGGDRCGTFNISTASAFVAAAAGVHVAKHGNRSVSSRSGSADVLEALGIRIDLPLQQAGRAIREIGIGFLFAPTAHAATRHAIAARQQIGERTVFNLLGPLTNPAGAHSQILGVFSAEMIDLVAATLVELGVDRAFVVHGCGGLDEISLTGETLVAEVRHGSVRRRVFRPEDFGLSPAPMHSLQGGTPQHNAAMIREVFRGKAGPPRDVVLMNSAAALLITDIARDLPEAMTLAEEALSSGGALEKLEALRSFTNNPQ
ncbi:MAG TPA: anthranilate phosphoribosyltransferase [Candidatus Eremiobacteraceae bacterium]|nr:anthranilate phosphoribosyltransferase [Candidatus Eremiobacteraceae bacterium]